jgi:hypothetical protein
MWKWSVAAFACTMLVGVPIKAEAREDVDPRYALLERIPGPPTVTVWDYATVDPRANRLLLSTRFQSGSGLTVLDLGTRRVASILGAKNLPHGVVVLRDGTVAVADAVQNAVLFIDPMSGRIAATVDTGKPQGVGRWHNPDALLMEPKTGLLIAVNGDSGALALVDVARHVTVGTIVVGGKLETAGARGDGTVYVNVESKNAIAAIDVPGRKVVGNFPLKGCENPSGLEYDSLDHLVISVCGNGVAKFIDPDFGSELASLKVARGADAVMFDSRRKMVFIAGGDDGVLSIIRIINRRVIRVIQNLKTQPGARLGAVDSTTGTLYLPAATPDLKAPPLRLPHMPAFPPAASGSFEFLAIGAVKVALPTDSVNAEK